MRQLEQSYESLMYALVAALDTRDHLAKGHSRRVVAYALAIADLLGISPADKQYLSVGGYLHDVGKIGVNDAILRKEASLTEAEWAEIRRHPQIGHEILNEVEFLGDASDVVLHHHERFDGHGYPTGLAGDKIPLIARVFAVADALDAMTADRPYRTAMSYSRAREVILEQTGTQFCPTCVKAFLALSDEELARIRKRAEEGRS